MAPVPALFSNRFRVRCSAAVLLLATFAVCGRPAPASAQDRPFVFSIVTPSDTTRPSSVLFSYDVGAGESSFRGSDTSSNGPEQRLLVQASRGRWTVVGHVGVATSGGSVESSQQGELLYSVLDQRRSGVNLALGGGFLHEASGTDVVIGRIVAGRSFADWRLQGNLVFQKPLSSLRDSVDLITVVGFARTLGKSWSLGVEGIGEDLEGFWDEAEAEGGARILVPAGR